MNIRLMTYASLILIGTFVSSIAQVMLKKAAMRQYKSRIKEYLNPMVIIAYMVFFGATFLSIYAYKVVPLSMGAILEATSYIYIMLFGITIFKEKISIKKICSLVLIIMGIVVYSI